MSDLFALVKAYDVAGLEAALKGAYAKLAAATGVDALQKQGYSALMIAASNGFPAACEVLLAAGADTSIKLADGKTAADIARERGHAELAMLLR